MAWTRNPTTVLGTEDMMYLRAFGSCVMAEKSRLDALYADRAKADFISSVSCRFIFLISQEPTEERARHMLFSAHVSLQKLC